MNATCGTGRRKSRVVFTMLAVAAASLWAAAFGDTLVLKSGQTLEGRVIESSDSVLLATPHATIAYGLGEVASIQHGPTPSEVYERRAATLESSDAEGHYELGAYAEGKGLIQEAHYEYEKVISADPNHAPARGKLGYVRDGKEWISRDDAMARSGYVRYKGRYIAKEQADNMLASDRELEGEREMRVVISALVETIRRSDGQDRKDAEDKMAGMSDPAALGALIEATQDPSASVRAAALAALENYREDEAALAVLDVAIWDYSANVRRQARTILSRKQNKAVFNQAVEFLDIDDDVTPFRASEVLGALGNMEVIPYLIEKLYWIRKPIQQTVTQENTADAPPSPVGPVYVAGLRTPNPRSVFGANEVSGVYDEDGNLIVLSVERTGVSQDFSSNPCQRVLNYDALSALQALTGQSFRFNKDAWQTWYLANVRRLNALPAPAGRS